jgi:hypothetical protein
MQNEVDRLLEDLDYIRDNAGNVGPDHPKVQKWVAEVRDYLDLQGNKDELKKFEQLGFVKSGIRMWIQQNVTPGGIRKYCADLDKTRVVLEKTAGSRVTLSADEKMRELYLNPDQETEGEESLEAAEEETVADRALVESKDEDEKQNMKQPQQSEKTMDEQIEPSFEAVTTQHISPSTREKTVDQLMAELSAEMKSLDPDWAKIQQVMGGLLGLKKTEELVERLKAEVKNPDVKWEPIRKLMFQLWSVKKDIIIELLPDLLGP